MKQFFIKSMILAAVCIVSSVNATTLNVDHNSKLIAKSVKTPVKTSVYTPLTYDAVSSDASGIKDANHIVKLADSTTVLGFDVGYYSAYFVGAKSLSTELVIPDSLRINNKLYAVTTIGSYYGLDFKQAESVKNLTLPPTITTIDKLCILDNITTNCYISNISNDNVHKIKGAIYVNAEDKAQYMANSSWYGCVMILEKGEQPNDITLNVANKGEFAQTLLPLIDSDWNRVNNLTVTGTLNEADLNVFKKCHLLLNVDLSGTEIENIPKNFLYDNAKILKSIKLPAINSINENAFTNCYKLKDVEIKSVKNVGYYSFGKTYDLNTIVFNDSLQSFGEYAFQESGIKSLVIPNTIKVIPSYLCDKTHNLKDLTLPDNLESIETNAFQYSGIESIDLKQVKKIKYRAFAESKNLKNITFGNSLREIEEYAFYGCTALKSVDLPETVEYVNNAFSSCDSITSFTCRAIIPPYTNGHDPMQSVDKTYITLYVPSQRVNTYRLAEGWDNLYTIKAMEDKINFINVHDNIKLSSTVDLAEKCGVEIKYLDKNIGSLRYDGEGMLSTSDFLTRHYYNYYIDQDKHPSLIAFSPMRADNIITEIGINSVYQWIFISFPYDVKVSDITYSQPCPFVIRTYSGANRAAKLKDTWYDLTNDSIMKAGRGYILRMNKGNTTFRFPSINNDNKNNYFVNTNTSVKLYDYPSEFVHNSSWNFIGNPYPCYYDIRFLSTKTPITVWKRDSEKYEAYSPIDDEYVLAPFEAFFIQKDVNTNALGFNYEGRQEVSTPRVMQSFATEPQQRMVFNLTLSDGENTDRTRVVFNDNASVAYEINKDASKFIEGSKGCLIYTEHNGVRYAINERPLSDAKVNLGLYIENDGQYTLELKNTGLAEVTLSDKELGVTHNLSSPYVFSAKQGHNDSRFMLTFNNMPTSIEDVAEEAKIDVTDGNLMVNAPYSIYSIDGKKIAQCNAGNTVALNKGVYVIVVNGERHKIVIK